MGPEIPQNLHEDVRQTSHDRLTIQDGFGSFPRCYFEHSKNDSLSSCLLSRETCFRAEIELNQSSDSYLRCRLFPANCPVLIGNRFEGVDMSQWSAIRIPALVGKTRDSSTIHTGTPVGKFRTLRCAVRVWTPFRQLNIERETPLAASSGKTTLRQ